MQRLVFNARVEYEDKYVQPIILAAVEEVLPPETYALKTEDNQCEISTPLLQIRAYESIDFERCFNQSKNLCNAYVIRKALIRKHYLSNTILSWVTKYPWSGLRNHFKPGEEFELDYAEFLDDALVEAFELRAAFDRNEGKSPELREWWILKPGMSDRGQGIRLFSTQDELQAIFDEWETDNTDNEQSEDEEAIEGNEASGTANHTNGDMIITSHLRHFIVQPYIDSPLLIQDQPFRNRKFHIRTYIVAAGALRVFVYNHMLALFASEPYQPPWQTQTVQSTDKDPEVAQEEVLAKLKNVHLTNTCVQTSPSSTKVDNVYLLSSLPLSKSIFESIRAQIHEATAEMFRAALAQPTNFQPFPSAFEIFGVDFLVEDAKGKANVQLLEVNAFPDFAQTGDELRDLAVKGLFKEIIRKVVGPFFGASDLSEKTSNLNSDDQEHNDFESLSKVLDLDLRRE